MSDVKEKAKALCRILDIPYPSNEYVAVLRSLREQDRDTRHALAEEIAGIDGITVEHRIKGSEHVPVGVSLISKDYAYNVVMSCRGGVE